MLKIVKLETLIYDGDWHDPPMRWQVQGPGTERQNFSTKENATTWARFRAKMSFNDAQRAWAKEYMK